MIGYWFLYILWISNLFMSLVSDFVMWPLVTWLISNIFFSFVTNLSHGFCISNRFLTYSSDWLVKLSCDVFTTYIISTNYVNSFHLLFQHIHYKSLYFQILLCSLKKHILNTLFYFIFLQTVLQFTLKQLESKTAILIHIV